MTSQDLEIFRLKVQLEALRVLLRGLITSIANSSPTGPQAFRDSYAKLRNEHGKITLKGLPPEYSDMLAAEYQEALEDLLSSIESGFHS